MHLLSMGKRRGVTGIKGNVSFRDSAGQAVVNGVHLGWSALETGAVRLFPGVRGDAHSQAVQLRWRCYLGVSISGIPS